jgi:hypothetical protein
MPDSTVKYIAVRKEHYEQLASKAQVNRSGRINEIVEMLSNPHSGQFSQNTIAALHQELEMLINHENEVAAPPYADKAVTRHVTWPPAGIEHARYSPEEVRARQDNAERHFREMVLNETKAVPGINKAPVSRTFCPHCGNDDLQEGEWDRGENGSFIVYMRCNQCEDEWEDVFAFSGRTTKNRDNY